MSLVLGAVNVFAPLVDVEGKLTGPTAVSIHEDFTESLTFWGPIVIIWSLSINKNPGVSDWLLWLVASFSLTLTVYVP